MQFYNILLFLISGCLAVTANSIISRTNKRVVFVHSYHPTYSWVIELNKGFTKGLFQASYFKGINLDMDIFYMYTKEKNTTPEEKTKRALEIYDEVMEIHKKTPIDLIVTSDDDAMGYFVPLVYQDFKVVFAGTAQFPEVYNQTFHFFDSRERPGRNVTGIFKKANFVYTLETFNTILRDSFQGKTIMILFDDTITGRSTYEQYLVEIAEKGYLLDELNIKTEAHVIYSFEDYKEYVQIVNNDSKYAAIYHLIFSLFSRYNISNFTHYSEEIYAWTFENAIKPTISYVAPFCKQGLLGGFGYSLIDVGYEHGFLAGRALRGDDISEIPINMEPKKEMFFNLDTIKKLGLDINNYYLSESVLYEAENYLEIILSISIPLLSVTIFFTIFIILIILLGYVCIDKQKKELKWTSTVATSIANLDLENELIIKLESSKKKHGKTGRVFTKIIKKLRKFKPYLPETVFVGEDQEEEEEAYSSSACSYDGSSSVQSYGSSRSSKKSSSKSGSKEKKKNHDNLGLYFEKKEVTVLVCSISEINELNQKLSNDSLLTIFNKFIELVSKIVQKHSGTLNFVKGQSILCTWNSIRKQNATHAMKCCDAALEISAEYQSLLKEWIVNGKIQNEISIYLSIFTDQTLCGNVGTQTIRTFNLFSDIEEKATKLCQSNKKYDSTILINSKCFELSKYYHDVKAIGVSEDKSFFFELIKKKDVVNSNEEWLYAFDKIEKSDLYKHYNEAFFSFHKKEFEKAREHLTIYLAQDETKKCKRGLKLQDLIIEKKLSVY